jgi:ribose 5-phosphate isomerase A
MTTSQDEQKKAVAAAAMQMIAPELRVDLPIGVGTGSTADCFIDALAQYRGRFAGAVASSQRSALRLTQHQITVLDLNAIAELPVYVDGADEVTSSFAMLKGGGGALSREKIVAAASRRFICIADESKLVERLGRFPLPIEVLPMARSYVIRRLEQMASPGGGQVRLRTDANGQPYMTDNGNVILDVSGLDIVDPLELEVRIDALAGVVSNGLFAARGADVVLLGGPDGVRSLAPAGQPRS